jgi:hypothetical protein
MWRQALILARSGLVPYALKGNTEGVMLVGMRGAELGWSFTTALDFIDVFEGRAVINAQGGLAVIRKAGHRARFVHEECNDTQAVIIGQRREADGSWGPEERITWTIEEARTAGLLDEWAERKVKRPGDQYDTKEKFVLRREGNGYVPGKFGATTMPDWVTKKIADGEVKHKDNWWNYPADQLKARVAARLRRNVFSDVMAAYGVDDFTAEEMGATSAVSDLDETVAVDQDDVVDGEIVEAEQGEDPGPIGEATAAPPVHMKADPTIGPEKWAAFVRWADAGEPRDENGYPVDVPAATTIEPEGGVENGDTDRGASAVPPAPGPVPRLATGGIDWREMAKRHGVTVGSLLVRARGFAEARSLPLPGAMEDVADEQLVADVLDWLGAE